MTTDPSMPPLEPPKESSRWPVLIAVLGALAIIGILFFNDVQDILAWLEAYGRSPWGVGIAILIFILGSYMLIPQWVLIGAAMTTFGFIGGVWISWVGTMIAVIVHLRLAEPFSARIRQRYTGSGLRRLMESFRNNSLKSGFVIRLVPSGPAVLVNSAAGLAGVKTGRFLIGTGLGIIPKILVTGFVAQGAISWAEGERIALWIMLGALFGLGQFLLIRYLRRKSRKMQ